MLGSACVKIILSWLILPPNEPLPLVQWRLMGRSGSQRRASAEPMITLGTSDHSRYPSPPGTTKVKWSAASAKIMRINTCWLHRLLSKSSHPGFYENLDRYDLMKRYLSDGGLDWRHEWWSRDGEATFFQRYAPLWQLNVEQMWLSVDWDDVTCGRNEQRLSASVNVVRLCFK